MVNRIMGILKQSSDLKLAMIDACATDLEHAAQVVITCLAEGGKLIAFGNGGSASQAEHLVGELVGRFYRERFPLPAIALTGPSALFTAVANDYGYDHVFARQIMGLAAPEDVLFALSTSGTSANVLEGLRAGHKIGCKAVALTGARPCPMDELADCVVKIPSEDTPRIQEGHAVAIHVVAQLAEEALAAEAL